MDVTAPQAGVHLKHFIKGKGVAKVFRTDITKTVSLCILAVIGNYIGVHSSMCISITKTFSELKRDI